LTTARSLSQLTTVVAICLTLQAVPADASHSLRSKKPQELIALTPAECSRVLSKVDELVRNYFYSEKVATSTWPAALAKERHQILASRNLVELDQRLNQLLKCLNSSHCEFATVNDEIFYFLRSLFCQGRKKWGPDMDFTGAIIGGVNCARHQVRYVLDGSPAAQAGLNTGDQIVKVDGQAYKGQISFAGRSGNPVVLQIRRGGRLLNMTITPVREEAYSEYVKAITKSACTIKLADATIGYIHLWTGGRPAHDAFEEALQKKLMSTDGLLLDLRDGYGANFFDDLDFFYRSPRAYPSFTTWTRNGKKEVTRLFYDKPVVALINGGVRSGKELLAFSLKQSGRAKLVGERTAGAVLGGRLFPISDRASLYLAVHDGEVAGVRLEGVGVSPDLEVSGESCQQSLRERQLNVARDLLVEEIKRARAGATSEPAAGAPKDSPAEH